MTVIGPGESARRPRLVTVVAMTTIQEFCAATGRTLTATPPMAVAAQPVSWEQVAPWTRIESPDPAAVIAVSPGGPEGFTPNALATCAQSLPAMEADGAASAIADTAEELPDWTVVDDVAGEGDEQAGAVRSVYRYLRGTYTSEFGPMATSSLIVGWSDPAATHVFQYVVTTTADAVDTHDAAMDALRIGEWTAIEIVHAMRG